MKILLTVIAAIGGLVGWLGAGAYLGSGGSAPVPSEAESPETSHESRTEDPPPPPVIEAAANGVVAHSFDDFSEFILALDRADVEDCRRWLQALGSHDGRPHIYRLAKIIFERWARLDPAGALAAARAEPSYRSHSADILVQWAREDVEAALHASLEGEQITDIYGVMRGAGPEHIQRVHDLLVERGVDKRSPGYFEAIFHHIGAVDIRKAADLALAFQLSSAQRTFGPNTTGMSNVLGMWLGRDASAALAWAESIENRAARKKILEQLTSKWVAWEPKEALEAMWDRTDFSRLATNNSVSIPGYRKRLSAAEFDALVEWVDARAATDPYEAEAVYHAMVRGVHYSGEYERLGTLITRLNSEEMPRNISSAIEHVSASWAAQDEEELLEFINSTEDAKIRKNATQGLLNHLARTDPLRGLEFVRQQEGEGDLKTDDLMKSLFDLSSDPDALIAQLPDSMRGAALEKRLRTLTHEDPLRAVEFLGRHDEFETTHHEHLMTISTALALQHPSLAAEMVDELEPGPDREFAAGNVAAVWAETNFDAAVEWSQSLDDPASRSRALERVVRLAAVHRPERGMVLAVEIENDRLRVQAVSNSLLSFARRDPDESMRLLEGAEVSGEMRAKIVETAAKIRAVRKLPSD